METTQIFFRKSRDFGQILNDTFVFVRLNFRRLLKCLIVIAGPAVLIAAILAGIYMSNIFATVTPGDSDAGRNFAAFSGLGVTMILLAIFGLVAMTLMVSVVYNYIILYMDAGPDSFDLPDVWNEVKRNVLRVFLTLLGQWFLMAVLAMLVVVPGVLFKQFVLTFMGMVVYIGALIYTLPPMLLLPIIRIREDIGFGDALSRSFELVKENWWRTAGLAVVMGIVAYVLTIVFYIPQYLLVMVSAIHSIASGERDANPFTMFTGPMRFVMILFTALPYLAASLVYSLPAITMAFQYFSLVERKDGTGLLERIEDFGSPSGDDTFR